MDATCDGSITKSAAFSTPIGWSFGSPGKTFPSHVAEKILRRHSEGNMRQNKTLYGGPNPDGQSNGGTRTPRGRTARTLNSSPIWSVAASRSTAARISSCSGCACAGTQPPGALQQAKPEQEVALGHPAAHQGPPRGQPLPARRNRHARLRPPRRDCRARPPADASYGLKRVAEAGTQHIRSR